MMCKHARKADLSACFGHLASPLIPFLLRSPCWLECLTRSISIRFAESIEMWAAFHT